jgi:hypothetical protein
MQSSPGKSQSGCKINPDLETGPVWPDLHTRPGSARNPAWNTTVDAYGTWLALFSRFDGHSRLSSALQCCFAPKLPTHRTAHPQKGVAPKPVARQHSRLV